MAVTGESGRQTRAQPSLAQLRAFAAVAEHLHFRDAAAAIGMSQPALSGAVSALEETLGVQLLERTTRKVLLSPAGERLAVRARAVLEAVGELLEEAEAARAPFTGVLRLGVIPTVAPVSAADRAAAGPRALPATWTSRCTRSRPPRCWTGSPHGRLDLLLLAVPLGVPRVTELPLFDEDFVLVTPAGPLAAAAAATSRARRCASWTCCCSTRATACATRPWTSAGRPAATRAPR